ncbi:MAG: hypothetical protein H7227_03315 [Actinobacteria bacterium]|nr:hypothetical protein [Actinomycetota bacterium]
MVSRTLLVALLVIVAAFFVLLTRWIVRLPHRYERHPRALNPWSALDSGIDPSDSEKSST